MILHLTFVLLFLALISPEIVFSKASDPEQRKHCLTTDEAEGLRDLWISFFVRVSDGGAQIRNSVTDDFKFYSESLNFATPGRTLPVCISASLWLFFPLKLEKGIK